MRYFLLGFMGCGKTFWGRRLGELHAMPWMDLDDYLSKQEAASIDDIFTTKGEAYFRRKEAEHLQAIVAANPSLILSTGGGTPCYHDLMAFMNQHGTTIYLKASVDHLYERLLKERTFRPLLKNLDDEGLRAFIQERLNEREPVYTLARYTIDIESADLATFDRIFTSHA